MEIFVFQDGRITQEVRETRGWTLPSKGFVWLDFESSRNGDWPAMVKECAGLEIFENHVADSANLLHPSFCDMTENYEMIIFRSLAPESEQSRIVSRPTAFFLSSRLLVTVHREESRSIAAVKKRLLKKSGRGPREPAELLHQILNEKVEHFLAIRKPLAERLEAWEDHLLESRKPFREWAMLQDHRKELRTLETLCEEQEDCITEWRGETDIEFNDHLEVRYNDLVEHIRRVLTHVRHAQAQLDSLLQLHFAAVSQRTNEIMRTLTVVAAIFLPLSLLAGVFGMNFEYMRIFHNPYGHLLVAGGMVTTALVLLGIFRFKKWI